MSLYARVLDDQIIETRDHAETPPILAPSKGVWLAVADGVETAPEGQVLASTVIELQDGLPVRVGVYEAAPRRTIPKSVVQARANDLGKLGLVMALLLQPENAVYFARWFAPDWPNVFYDDEQMLLMLGAVGCTAEEIATITAPV